MRVAVLGAGYAGLTVARRLERQVPDGVELVVVDESDSHLLQHELHRLVRHPDLVDAITVPLADVLDRATVRRARVTDVDPEAGVATLDPDDGGDAELRYDLAAVCLGSETAFHGIPGVAEHAHPLKRIGDAEAIRDDALGAPDGTAVVGGAGLSGVQAAGELAALSAEADLALDVTLLERTDRIVPGFGAAFADAVATELEARGVSIETDARVTEAEADTAHLSDGRTLPADVFVWTGGIRGPDALDGERLPTGADLRDGDGTFVVGDAAAVTDADGSPVPATAQTAVQEATVAAANIVRTLDEPSAPRTGRLSTYEYDDAGWVVTVGDGAVAQVGDVVLTGAPARLAKAVIGGGHLGSIGAIGEASDLVAEELGWPTLDAARRLPHVSLPTDPSSTSSLQSTLGTAAFDLAGAVLPGDTTDLSWLTRLADRDYPGSPVSGLDRECGESLPEDVE
ncbi:MAG: NAD(P)/FAD-dependent oxidoreductase [Halorientalis sp.]